PVKALLADNRPSAELFSNLQQIVMILEASGRYETAQTCLSEIEKAFQSVSEPALVEAVARTIAGARKRLSLIGQPLVVEGVTIDGKPFDWTSYQGKVVL